MYQTTENCEYYCHQKSIWTQHFKYSCKRCMDRQPVTNSRHMKLIKAELDDFIGHTSYGLVWDSQISKLLRYWRISLTSKNINLTISNFPSPIGKKKEDSNSPTYGSSQFFELRNYLQKGVSRSTIWKPKSWLLEGKFIPFFDKLHTGVLL